MRLSAILVGAVLCCLATASSAVPITRSDFGRLLVELDWAVGDRGPSTISLQYGISADMRGYLKISETYAGNVLGVEGYAELGPGEADQILMLEKATSFSSLPSRLPDVTLRNGVDGEQIITICYSSLRISERWPVGFNDIKRQCNEEKAITVYASALIRMAQKHFPDIGSSAVWRAELSH